MTSRGAVKSATVIRCCVAVLLWLGLGFSLGWYYTFTYYGRTGIPIPAPEGVLSIILYYFSVINTALWIEAVHWMAVFPIAGIVWAGAFYLIALRFGGLRAGLAEIMFRLSLAYVPLVIVSPYMMYMAGQTHADGFELSRALAVALRRGNISVPCWLTPLYLSLGVLALIMQIRAAARVFNARGLNALRIFLLSLLVAILATASIGAAAALPLRLIFE